MGQTLTDSEPCGCLLEEEVTADGDVLRRWFPCPAHMAGLAIQHQHQIVSIRGLGDLAVPVDPIVYLCQWQGCDEPVHGTKSRPPNVKLCAYHFRLLQKLRRAARYRNHKASPE